MTLRIRRLAVVALAAALLVSPALPAQAAPPLAVPDSTWGANARVSAVVVTPTRVYLGGDFTALVGPGGQTLARRGVAALDAVTGQPVAGFDAQASGPVKALALSPDGSRLYLGGQFDRVGGTSRPHAAAVSAASGALVTAWNPAPNRQVKAIAVRGSAVYLGGDFTAVSGANQQKLAGVDAGSGARLPGWTGTADGQVRALAVAADGSKLLVGGKFGAVNGDGKQNNLAAVDPGTGRTAAWAYHPGFPVFDIEATAAGVYLAGGGKGGTAAGLTTAGALRWTVKTDGDVQAVAAEGTTVYVGGHFTQVGGRKSGHATAVSSTDGADLTWPVWPNSNLGVWALDSTPALVAMGGDFTEIDKRRQPYLALFG